MKYRNRYAISIASFFLFFCYGVLFFGELGCSDGWNSSSIGRQGACSHHGGVDALNGGSIFLGALIVSIVIFALVAKFGKR